MSQRTRVTCGLCGGSHSAGLPKCPFCGSKGVVEEHTPVVEVAPEELPVYHHLMLATVCGFSLLLLFYIAPMHPLHSPGIRAVKLLIGASLLVAVLGIKDAQHLARTSPANSIRPEKWFVQLLFGWPFMLPLYFRQRAHLMGEEPRRAPTVITVAAAVVAFGTMVIVFRGEEKYRPSSLQNRTTPVVHDHWPPHHGDSSAPHAGAQVHEHRM